MKDIAFVGFVICAYTVAILAFIGGILYMVWNYILLNLFDGVKPISFIAACALGLLLSILFKLLIGNNE